MHAILKNKKSKFKTIISKTNINLKSLKKTMWFYHISFFQNGVHTLKQCCGSGMIYSESGLSFEFSEFWIQAKVPDPCRSGSGFNPCSLSICGNCKQNHLKFNHKEESGSRSGSTTLVKSQSKGCVIGSTSIGLPKAQDHCVTL